MDYSKTPHACFKVEGSSVTADEELPRMLANQLKTRFAAVQVDKMPFTSSWAIVLQVEQQSIAAVLGRSKYEDDEWILLVGPSNGPRLLDRVRGRKEVTSSAWLIRTCREIHAVLTTTPSISALRWYFEGFHSQTTAVATPDELPWDQG